jgi:hypothetical protein
MKKFIKSYNELIYEDVLLEGKCEAIYKAQQEAQAQTNSSTPPPTGESTSTNIVDAEVVE